MSKFCAVSRGLYVASENVERNEFHDYVSTLDLAKNYPGIQGVGFSLIIPPQKKARHIEAVRKEGFPDYTCTRKANATSIPPSSIWSRLPVAT